MTTKDYGIEFAVESSSELSAINYLEEIGFSRARDAKLSDFDNQAELFIIRVLTSSQELTDKVYRNLQNSSNVHILSDELSNERADQVISLANEVELQLKRLLIYALPEIEKVMSAIIERIKGGRPVESPTTRIGWAKEVHSLTLGQTIRVLEIDIAEPAQESLSTGYGLLSLIISSKNYDELKDKLDKILESKTVWSIINSMLKNPVEYNKISGALNKLCKARNDAAHLNTITSKRLEESQRHHAHIMKYIYEINSHYRESLQKNIKILTSSMDSILESISTINPEVFKQINESMSEAFKPLFATLSGVKLNMPSQDISKVIKIDPIYSKQIADSMSAVTKNIMSNPEATSIMKVLKSTNFQDYTSDQAREAELLKKEVSKLGSSTGEEDD